jgi:hypothetical protein
LFYDPILHQRHFIVAVFRAFNVQRARQGQSKACQGHVKNADPFWGYFRGVGHIRSGTERHDGALDLLKRHLGRVRQIVMRKGREEGAHLWDFAVSFLPARTSLRASPDYVFEVVSRRVLPQPDARAKIPGATRHYPTIILHADPGAPRRPYFSYSASGNDSGLCSHGPPPTKRYGNA